MRMLSVYLICLLVFINGIPALMCLRPVPWSPLWIYDQIVLWPWDQIGVWIVAVLTAVAIVRTSGRTA
jgi:hypothetical protein